MEPKAKILLFRGTGVIDALIRWQTWGKYAHAAILLPDGKTLIESVPWYGVRMRQITDFDRIDVFDVPSYSKEQIDKAVDFARTQIGKKYAYLDIIRFIIRTKGNEQNSWFCSELVFAAFQKAGIDLLARIPAWKVSPQGLSTSPLMVELKR
jgi:uncharacterized protein YycO